MGKRRSSQAGGFNQREPSLEGLLSQDNQEGEPSRALLPRVELEKRQPPNVISVLEGRDTRAQRRRWQAQQDGVTCNRQQQERKALAQTTMPG